MVDRRRRVVPFDRRLDCAVDLVSAAPAQMNALCNRAPHDRPFAAAATTFAELESAISSLYRVRLEECKLDIGLVP